jgi:hypothetical protein
MREKTSKKNNNELEGLTGLVLVDGVTDCYSLCSAARLHLGRSALLAPIAYSECTIKSEFDRYKSVYRDALKNGDIAIFPALDNCGIGTYCDGMILLFNRHKISTIVPINSLLSLKFFGDPK